MIHFFEKMRNFGTILIASLLLLSGCYDNHNEPLAEPFATQANAKIEILRQLCAGGCYNIVSDMVCVGRVTSSDKSGNFYRSIFIEDETGAVEIKLGTYNIEAQYPIGLMVAVRLKGCAIMLKENILQVGLPPQSYDTAPREFEAQEVIDRHIVRSNSVKVVTPLLRTITQLDTSLCGRFVRIENLHHTPLDNKQEEEFYRFIDNEEQSVFLHISPYSNFATLQMPDSEVAIQGILYHESVGYNIGKQFVIKPRFADDITNIEYNM